MVRTALAKAACLKLSHPPSHKGAIIQPGVRVGYYRQDFSTLNFSDDIVYDSLAEVMEKPIEENLRSTAAGFLLSGEVMKTKIGSLSEGQKGLVAFCWLVLQKPGLLILDEPTTYLDMQSQRVILEALKSYKGAMLFVSHTEEFIEGLTPSRMLLLPENTIKYWLPKDLSQVTA